MDRSDNDAPIASLSKTASDAPRRETPITDKAEPMRAKDRKAIEAPNCV
jgi:hypothetical protein